jgi:hypothetical protein
VFNGIVRTARAVWNRMRCKTDHDYLNWFGRGLIEVTALYLPTLTEESEKNTCYMW